MLFHQNILSDTTYRIIERDNKAQNLRFHGVVITLVLANTVIIVECTTHTHMHAFVFITETDCNLIKDSNTLQIEDDKCAVCYYHEQDIH